jgi:hypothetical protein
MESLEVHIITDEFDADRAHIAGLLDEPFYTDVCAHCGEDVGSLDKFEPFVFVLGEDDLGYCICSYCATPVTNPGETDVPDEDDDEYEVLDFND